MGTADPAGSGEGGGGHSEEWRRTGRPHLARRLRRAGIVPVPHAH